MEREQVKGFANVNGTRLYYETAGAGPTLVLIPGYTLDTRMWDDQMEAFLSRYQVIRYDLRGFGRSAFPAQESYTRYDDLKALLDFLDIGKAHILGLSLGGAVAIDFALTYPDRTDSLISVDTSGLGGFPWPEELDRWFEAIYSAAGRGDLELAKERWLNTGWFKPACEKPAVRARLEQIVADYSGWDLMNENPLQALAPPANDRLEEINAPTLVIIGERDLPFYNHLIADALAQRIPNAQKVIIPNVGHMSNMEDPLSFNRIVLSFLSGLS